MLHLLLKYTFDYLSVSESEKIRTPYTIWRIDLKTIHWRFDTDRAIKTPSYLSATRTLLSSSLVSLLSVIITQCLNSNRIHNFPPVNEKPSSETLPSQGADVEFSHVTICKIYNNFLQYVHSNYFVNSSRAATNFPVYLQYFVEHLQWPLSDVFTKGSYNGYRLGADLKEAFFM